MEILQHFVAFSEYINRRNILKIWCKQWKSELNKPYLTNFQIDRSSSKYKVLLQEKTYPGSCHLYTEISKRRTILHTAVNQFSKIKKVSFLRPGLLQSSFSKSLKFFFNLVNFSNYFYALNMDSLAATIFMIQGYLTLKWVKSIGSDRYHDW